MDSEMVKEEMLLPMLFSINNIPVQLGLIYTVRFPDAHIILEWGGIKSAGLEEVNRHLLYVMLLTGSWLSGLSAEYFPACKGPILNFEWTTDIIYSVFASPSF